MTAPVSCRRIAATWCLRCLLLDHVDVDQLREIACNLVLVRPSLDASAGRLQADRGNLVSAPPAALSHRRQAATQDRRQPGRDRCSMPTPTPTSGRSILARVLLTFDMYGGFNRNRVYNFLS